MKQTFVIRTNQPDYPRVTTTGLLTPVPGLAITDVAHKARIAWGGVTPRTGVGVREPIEDA